MLSYGSYPANGDHSPVSTQYNALVSLTGDTKLTALSEVGVMPDPALITTYGLRWSLWCTWNGDFISGGSYNSLTFLKSAYSDPSVINLGGLPTNWKSYGTATTTTAKPQALPRQLIISPQAPPPRQLLLLPQLQQLWPSAGNNGKLNLRPLLA